MITFPIKTIQKSLLTLLFLTFLQFSFAQSSVDVKLYPSEKAPQISKHIYGHFAEHLGRCIYGGFLCWGRQRNPKSGGCSERYYSRFD